MKYTACYGLVNKFGDGDTDILLCEANTLKEVYKKIEEEKRYIFTGWSKKPKESDSIQILIYKYDELYKILEYNPIIKKRIK